MELAILAVILIAVAIYYGLFGSVETAARMATRKVERLEAEQIKADITYYKENEIKDEDFTGAISAKAQFKTFRDL